MIWRNYVTVTLCIRTENFVSFGHVVVTCPIARPIAHSIGRLLIQFVSVTACVCVRLSACSHSKSRSHFSIDFRQKCYRGNNPQSKNEFVGVNISPLLPPFCPWKPPSWRQRVLKIHANKYTNFCLKCSRISGIPASYRKFGSMSTTVTSDLRPEVETRHFWHEH